MTTKASSSRRSFLKTTGLALGTAATLPSWIDDSLAAEAIAATAVDKEGLADVALSTAKRLGAAYADIRINRYRYESIATRERQVQNVAQSSSFGFGVRVLVNGTWGFAANRTMTPEEVRRTTAQAVEVAR